MKLYPTKEILGLFLTIPLAAVLWYVAFVLKLGNFWLKISLSASLLAGIALLLCWDVLRTQLRVTWQHAVIGLVSAAILYGIFWLGNVILTTLFASTKSSIQSVYASKGAIPVWGVTVLLLFVTSPAEEIFWRGFVQREFMQHFSPIVGLMLASLCYAGVHLCTLNIPLVLAAFTAGIFWGVLYIWQESLIPIIISHAVWSVTIFIFLPFG